MPKYLALHPTPVANTEICKSLFTHKRTRKIASIAKSFRSKCLKFASSCLERGLAHWVIKCTYRELRSVLGLLQKLSWCAEGGNEQHLFQQHDFPFKVYKGG